MLSGNKADSIQTNVLEKGCDGLEVIAAIMDDKLDEIRLNLPNHRTKILLKASSLRKKVLVEMPSNSLVIQRKVCYELLLLLCFAYCLVCCLV